MNGDPNIERINADGLTKLSVFERKKYVFRRPFKIQLMMEEKCCVESFYAKDFNI